VISVHILCLDDSFTQSSCHNGLKSLNSFSVSLLVAREICRELLQSGPDALLNKIAAVITAGTPLEGARFGNFLLRHIPFLSPKIAQLATVALAFDNYRLAIRGAKEREVRRPKQLHIRRASFWTRPTLRS
jgi:hypothetical protein